MDNPDYSKKDLAALDKELKTLKQAIIVSALFIGFNIGVILYGNITKGFGWVYTIIPILLISASVKHQQLKNKALTQIKAELLNRKQEEL